MRRDFATTLPDRQRHLEAAWHEVIENDWNAEGRDAAYRAAHSLAGAAETFGFSDLGQAARALNDTLHEFQALTSVTPDQQTAAEILYAKVLAAFGRI